MSQLAESADRRDLATWAANRLLVTEGQVSLTTRKITAVMGMSQSMLNHLFRDRRTMLKICCVRAGRAMVGELAARIRTGGVDSVPDWCDEDRAWIAWCDLARTDDDIAFQVAQIEEDERAVLGRLLPTDAPDDVRDLLAAATRGLRASGTRAYDPVSQERAADVLRAYLVAAAAALERRAATIASGSSAE